MEKCIVTDCEQENRGMWFCPFHTKIKQQAYAEAKEKGLTNYYDIMALRDQRLSENKYEETDKATGGEHIKQENSSA